MKNKAWIIPVVISVAALSYGIFATARLQSDVFWMPIGIVGLTFSILWFTLFAPMLRNRRILKNGEPGSARVLRMFETGITVNNNPVVKLELEVTPSRGSTYVTTTKVMVSRLNPMMYGPGTVVSVKIDRQDRMQVAIDAGTASTAPAGGMSRASSVEFTRTTQQRNDAMQELIMAADKIRNEVLVSPTSKDAEGTILSLWSLDVNVNDIAVAMEFLVEVEIPGQSNFKTEIKGVVGNENLGKYQVGARVKLKYDPADPRHRITISGVKV